jgi:predicted nicotinamide N-methyase
MVNHSLATASSQDLLVDMALSVDESEPLDRIDQLKLYKGDPYGAVLWPAASALAQYLLTKVSEQTKLSELKILELGTGTGLVSLVAALAGAKHVLATDYEPVPLNILKHAIQVNALEHRLTDDEINHRVDKLANIKTGTYVAMTLEKLLIIY